MFIVAKFPEGKNCEKVRNLAGSGPVSPEAAGELLEDPRPGSGMGLLAGLRSLQAGSGSGRPSFLAK